jgi:hypothetical protein
MRTRRWRLAALCAGIAVVVLLAILTWPVPLQDRVRRIQHGMTLPEVVAIVGQPPGNSNQLSGDGEWWWLDEGVLYVRFDEDGRVDGVMFGAKSDPPSFWKRWRSNLPQ